MFENSYTTVKIGKRFLHLIVIKTQLVLRIKKIMVANKLIERQKGDKRSTTKKLELHLPPYGELTGNRCEASSRDALLASF